MSVADHLHIDVAEYDARIRTFVPGYERMIAKVAESVRLVDASAPTIIDLGIGTGALAAACLDVHPDARLVGLDADPAMLAVARARLARHAAVELVAGSFLDVVLPPADAIVACLALHHVPTEAAKRALYSSCRAALRPGGLLISADCFPARERRLAAREREAWLAHLERSYTRAEAERHLSSWAEEDVYVPLADELEWMRAAGLAPEVVWRTGGFAVVVAATSVVERGHGHEPGAA